MAARNKIVDLRNLLAQRFPITPPARSGRLQTGFAFLDDTIAGGLPKAAITEIISPHLSAGSASLIAALLQAAQRDRYFLALIDGRDSFDPQPIDNAILQHLLWLRCRNAREAMKAADLLLRDGNFPLVIVDLVLNPAEELRKIPQPSWYRLQRLVEATSSALLVLSRQSMVASARLKVVLENAWALCHVEEENAVARLRLRVQRSHVRASNEAEAAG